MPVYPLGVCMSIAFHCLMQRKEPRRATLRGSLLLDGQAVFITPSVHPGGGHPTYPGYPDRRVRRMDPDLPVRLAVVQ